MLAPELADKAAKIWVEYGKILCETFGFEGNLVVGPLVAVLQTGTEDLVQEFIRYVREKTIQLQNPRMN